MDVLTDAAIIIIIIEILGNMTCVLEILKIYGIDMVYRVDAKRP